MFILFKIKKKLLERAKTLIVMKLILYPSGQIRFTWENQREERNLKSSKFYSVQLVTVYSELNCDKILVLECSAFEISQFEFCHCRMCEIATIILLNRSNQTIYYLLFEQK